MLSQTKACSNYAMIDRVRHKLILCTKRRKQQRKDLDLRVLVGHASLLDRLMDDYEENMGSSDDESDYVLYSNTNNVSYLQQPRPMRPQEQEQQQQLKTQPRPQCVSV